MTIKLKMKKLASKKLINALRNYFTFEIFQKIPKEKIRLQML